MPPKLQLARRSTPSASGIGSLLGLWRQGSCSCSRCSRRSTPLQVAGGIAAMLNVHDQHDFKRTSEPKAGPRAPTCKAATTTANVGESERLMKLLAQRKTATKRPGARIEINFFTFHNMYLHHVTIQCNTCVSHFLGPTDVGTFYFIFSDYRIFIPNSLWVALKPSVARTISLRLSRRLCRILKKSCCTLAAATWPQPAPVRLFSLFYFYMISKIGKCFYLKVKYIKQC